jgi:hypothetical protein
MSEENVEIARAAFEAWSTHDLARQDGEGSQQRARRRYDRKRKTDVASIDTFLLLDLRHELDSEPQPRGMLMSVS